MKDQFGREVDGTMMRDQFGRVIGGPTGIEVEQPPHPVPPPVPEPVPVPAE